MNSIQETDYASLVSFFREPPNEYTHATTRNRLLVAISVAEVGGYLATREALIELLRELEFSKNPRSLTELEIGCM